MVLFLLLRRSSAQFVVYNLSSGSVLIAGRVHFCFVYISLRSEVKATFSKCETKYAHQSNIFESVGLLNMKITYQIKYTKTSNGNKTLFDHIILNILFPKLSLNFSNLFQFKCVLSLVPSLYTPYSCRSLFKGLYSRKNLIN